MIIKSFWDWCKLCKTPIINKLYIAEDHRAYIISKRPCLFYFITSIWPFMCKESTKESTQQPKMCWKLFAQVYFLRIRVFLSKIHRIYIPD